MDLTNEQWNAIKHHFPPTRPGRGRPAHESRRVLDGILWKIRNGESWHAIPSQYPSHQTCHRFYHAWQSSRVMWEIYQNLHEDLVYRGNFTPYRAVEESRITFHIQQRTFKFYIAPRFQNDWRTNTALLMIQVEFRRALNALRRQISIGRINARNFTHLELEFSKWSKFAPLLPDGRIVETYAGPEDIVFRLKQQKLYPVLLKKYHHPEIQRSIFGNEIFESESFDTETLDA